MVPSRAARPAPVDPAVLLDQRQARQGGAATTTWKWSPPPVRSITSPPARPETLEQASHPVDTHASIVPSTTGRRPRRLGGTLGELDHHLAPFREAIRQGRSPRSTSTTTRSPSQKIASSEAHEEHVDEPRAGTTSFARPRPERRAALHAHEGFSASRNAADDRAVVLAEGREFHQIELRA
jgi:hypothetical protein